MTIHQIFAYEEEVIRLERIALETKNPKCITDFIFEHGLWKDQNIDDIPGEIWVQFNSVYKVSNLGRVKSMARMHGTIYKGDRIIKQRIKKNGYLEASLCSDARPKFFLIHRLVGISCLRNPDNLPQINHIKGCKLDNRAIRIEWSTQSDNQKHGYAIGVSRQDGEFHATKKLNWDKVREIRKLHSEGIDKFTLGNQFGVHFGHINNIIAGTFWKEKN